MSRCSIVIPVHNRAAVTRDCLRALEQHPPSAESEIVVVDDASTDLTPGVLSDFGSSIRTVRRDSNAGFATACNDGAAAATGEYLLFLNNDTLPLEGWLDALLAYAERESSAVVGAKLLFPNATVQHAGVVICEDGNPRHIYAGLPADHPVVNRSRRFQAVTAACMLVRRTAFEEVGGFDPAFHNCLEDTDLCLRIGERGHEVHYCHESVAYHLESLSRGRRSKDIERNGRLFRDRWHGRAQSDELRRYVDDGLLRIGYRDSYPIRMEIAPELASVGPGGTQGSRALDARSAQVLDLLQETVRLSAHIAERELSDEKGPTSRSAPRASSVDSARTHDLDREGILDRAREIETEIQDLQAKLAGAVGVDSNGPARDRFAPSEYLSYRSIVAGVRAAVTSNVPGDGTVVVLSRGDDELLDLGGRRAWHFPRSSDGTYLGHYPADSTEAIEHLEELCKQGADYLVIPSTAFWWLEHYSKFAEHVRRSFDPVPGVNGPCRMFRLRSGGASDG